MLVVALGIGTFGSALAAMFIGTLGTGVGFGLLLSTKM